MRPHHITYHCDTETPITLFAKMAEEESYAFLFESAESHTTVGRYSFIGFDQRQTHVFESGGETNPLDTLRRAAYELNYEASDELPRLQAGFVGFMSYETIRHFEKLDLPLNGTSTPEAIFFLPRFLVVFDHLKRTVTLIAYAEDELTVLKDLFARALTRQNPTALAQRAGGSEETEAEMEVETAKKKDFEELLGQNSAQEFEKLVRQAQEDICAGEIFQVVLSQEFSAPTSLSALELYRRLRVTAPSPYLFNLRLPSFSVVGSSPETLVRVEEGEMIIRPIAGTRRRGETLQADEELEADLLSDEKECAEHMMLVDLGRHDVGRVCEPGSVRMTQLMQPERFSHLIHLVSEVRGRLTKECDIFEAFRASFPAGTLTGAPKIRAMQLIADYEKTPRGIYGGAVGYFGLNETMDFAIAIRTMIHEKGSVKLRAGAGIVYDSQPTNEYHECLNKARGPLSSLTH
ncbi:anthranilate synthase component I [Candidatus Peregrinibacteria bacterium CG_4_9_14_0_2_um_filter_53_11]|nr:MAG: anthranilate synthase component I [Candidatus Peregrinibacteria bacterium CG_4_9_14_0_2_um_filter_53_11]